MVVTCHKAWSPAPSGATPPGTAEALTQSKLPQEGAGPAQRGSSPAAHVCRGRLYANRERSWERRSAGCVASEIMKRRVT